MPVPLIIDTDAGCDDALAMLIALRHPEFDVKAITTVFGNVPLKQATENVRSILKVFGAQHVPLFAGASKSLLLAPSAEGWPGHGSNGLGDAVFESNEYVKSSTAGGDDIKVGKDHAATALVRLIHESEEPVTLVCLGPLTNIALALVLEPSLPEKIGKILVMGGAVHGRGNHTPSAEFNFGLDPEAAHTVLKSFTADKLTLVPWEAAEDACLTWAHFDQLAILPSIEANFFRKVNAAYEKMVRKDFDAARDRHTAAADQKAPSLPIPHPHHPAVEDGYTPCDAFVVAILATPSVVRKEKSVHVHVTLDGSARGGLAVDWYGLSSKPANARVIVSLDPNVFFEELHNIFVNSPNKLQA